MLMGIVFLRHRYTLSKYLSVLLITAGLIVCTLEDYRVRHSIDFEQLLFEPNTGSVRKTTIGIGFLTASLLLSAAIGIYQEFLSKSFGKFPQQMLFYVVRKVTTCIFFYIFFLLISLAFLGIANFFPHFGRRNCRTWKSVLRVGCLVSGKWLAVWCFRSETTGLSNRHRSLSISLHT